MKLLLLFLVTVHAGLNYGSSKTEAQGHPRGETNEDTCRERLDTLETKMQLLLESVGSATGKYNEKILLQLKDRADAKRADDTGPWEAVAQQLSQQIGEMSARITALENDKQDLLGQIQTLAGSGGSTYVRWGRTACEGDSETVYSGTMGGPLWTDRGSGSNLLCMPPNPVFDNYRRTTCGPSTIYGAEYHVCPEPHHENDVVCAVCRSLRASTLMIPATNVCPDSWTAEYTGHVMGGYGGYDASTDYVCVDRDPEDRPGGQTGQEGQRLYYTIAKCGTLPCPPYQEDKILSCAVCTK